MGMGNVFVISVHMQILDLDIWSTPPHINLNVWFLF